MSMINPTSDEKPKVKVISPDEKPGKDFVGILSNLGINTSNKDKSIPPRVDRLEITSDIFQVAEALAASILEEIESGLNILTIACNTLSLPIFVDQALRIINDKIDKSEQSFKLVLTIPEIKFYIEDNPDKKIIVLGTIPLSKILADKTQGPLPTAVNFEGHRHDILLSLVQEIIWRIKARQGSNVSTAPIYEERLDDEHALIQKLRKLNELLTTMGIDDVIMGCTELPEAFKIMSQIPEIEINYTLIDPATLVAKKIKDLQNQSN